ncbi:hypothetical protein ES702_01960 [subsurface metagenome]
MSEDTIIVDDDMRSLLEDLKTHYVAADDGHLIRAVLRERRRRLNRLYNLEGPDVI